MLEIIESPEFKNLIGVKHGVFTRQGGVSTGYYASLNCSGASKDDPENIKENRRRVVSYLQQPLGSLVTTRSIHSNKAVIVTQPWSEELKPDADAIVTNQKGIILGSDSADCPIVLLADESAGIVGLAHAGWRGAKEGILEATVEKMLMLGANDTDISAVIMPCISQNSYEVGPEFYEQFLKESLSNQYYFKPSNKTDYTLFNLRHYVKDRLLKLRLKRVFEIEMDTYTSEREFYSYRRAYHRGELDFGGHLSFIYLEPVIILSA